MEDDRRGGDGNVRQEDGGGLDPDGGDFLLRALLAHHAVFHSGNAHDLHPHQPPRIPDHADEQDPEDPVEEIPPQPLCSDDLGPVGLGVDPPHHGVG